jgi:nuclear receptor coactivator 4
MIQYKVIVLLQDWDCGSIKMNQYSYVTPDHNSLLSETQRKIKQLEDAIHQINNTKKHLKENSSEVKRQITTTFSRQLESLRNREVWLLGQVELIEHAKEEVLRKQKEKLCHLLGGLQTGLEYSEEDDNVTQGKLDRKLSESIDRLDELDLKPEETPNIGFRADVAEMRDCVRNFGRVDSRSLNLPTAFAHPEVSSASLPRTFEDYEDAEHHVLYKTLADVKRDKNNDSSIDVKIPKLQKPTAQWLSYTPASTPVTITPTSGGEGHFTFPPPGGELGAWLGHKRGSSAHSIQYWLQQIKQQVEGEEDYDDFELLSPPHTRSMSECSESIELMHLVEHKPIESSAAQTFDYFNQVSTTPHANWLLKEEANKTQLEDISGGCCRGQCSSEEASAPIDIENLDLIMCVDAGNHWKRANEGKTWLSHDEEKENAAKTWLSRGDEEKEVDEMERIEGVCRANETCRSFSDCLCDDRCCSGQSAAPEITPSQTTQGWLKSSKNASSIMEDVRESPLFSYFRMVSQNASDWLAAGVAVPDDLPYHLFPVFQAPESAAASDWLMEEASGPEMMDTAAVASYKCRFLDDAEEEGMWNSAAWLSDTEPAALCHQDEMLTFTRKSGEKSTWLTPVTTSKHQNDTEMSFHFNLQPADSDNLCWMKSAAPTDSIADTFVFTQATSDNHNWLKSEVSDHQRETTEDKVFMFTHQTSDNPAWLQPDVSGDLSPDGHVYIFRQPASSDNSLWLKSPVCVKNSVSSQADKSSTSQWLLDTSSSSVHSSPSAFTPEPTNHSSVWLTPAYTSTPSPPPRCQLFPEKANEMNIWLLVSSGENKPSECNQYSDEFTKYSKIQKETDWLQAAPEQPAYNTSLSGLSEKMSSLMSDSSSANVSSKERIWLKQEEMEPEEDSEDDCVWLMRKESATSSPVHDPSLEAYTAMFPCFVRKESGMKEWLADNIKE